MRVGSALACAGVTGTLVLLVACTSQPTGQTIASLERIEPDTTEVLVSDGLEKALESYRHYLEETAANALTPEAMRRLADLQIERQYGIIGGGEMSAPEPMTRSIAVPARSADPDPMTSEGSGADITAREPAESDAEFERRTTAMDAIAPTAARLDGAPSFDADADDGPRQAIETYKKILTDYPDYQRNDQVLYQMARAYDELGQPDEAMQIMERLVDAHPDAGIVDEVYFRRGEYYFVRKKYLDAEDAYGTVVALGADSSFFELALYKLGWTLYKQELYEDALHRYIALLDHKLSVGYDFDQAGADEDDERRIADTLRIISLAFSNLGGPEVLNAYFAANGSRVYEDRIYANLAEFYLSKLRYNDAATVYESFVELNPLHKLAPHFSMRVVDIYAEGGFAKLVVDSKKTFATRYGLESPYWRRFAIDDMPEVSAYLKTNLEDLATHYHALYREPTLADDQAVNYAEATRWYREFLDSFADAKESPAINYRFADLLLENQDFLDAAREYQRTAYDYAPHDQAAEAGYAAVYAYREQLKVDAEATRVKQAAVESSLRFAEAFPTHAQAATVLGAAAEDLYAMSNFERAIEAGRTLIEQHVGAEPELRRSAWSIVAHSSFDLERFVDAEHGYSEVLSLTPEADEARQKLLENLAAAIYKQGELENHNGNFREAADHFLRIKDRAPSSAIRASAEYDAAAAYIQLADWGAAAEVLRGFRASHSEHELASEVTKQLAFVYQQAGELARSAQEYEQVAADATEPRQAGEALLVAGGLYEQAAEPDSALRAYRRYVDAFAEPVETAVETRFKIAALLSAAGAIEDYHEELRRIVVIDGAAGDERTDRTRYLAGQSALTLTKLAYEHFLRLRLTQPFERSLADKQQRMDDALRGFERLIDYEVAEVTAAATFYIAEIYGAFGQALLDSDRPDGLDAAEQAEYELAIEAEAFPFEERTIDVHEKNLELMLAGTWNDWVQQSLDRLGVLMPGRYAKDEISGGFIGAIDVYAYVAPVPPSTLEDGGVRVALRPEVKPVLAGIARAEGNGAADETEAFDIDPSPPSVEASDAVLDMDGHRDAENVDRTNMNAEPAVEGSGIAAYADADAAAPDTESASTDDATAADDISAAGAGDVSAAATADADSDEEPASTDDAAAADDISAAGAGDVSAAATADADSDEQPASTDDAAAADDISAAGAGDVSAAAAADADSDEQPASTDDAAAADDISAAGAGDVSAAAADADSDEQPDSIDDATASDDISDVGAGDVSAAF